MTRTIDADYLVVGAGAMGMAFTDALIDHADVRVAVVDRRHSVGGHWLEAYPFVRLHQASAFYGVPSTLLGGGQLQQRGPEQGLQERASQAEICEYYARAIDRMVEAGKVEFYPNSRVRRHARWSRASPAQRYEVAERCRVVDARYLAPSIPAETPPPFDVGEGARVIPVNDLARLEDAPSQYVVVGSGKTATDACIWLLSRGVDPDAICWVRPREPWMMNRAVVQPDPAIFLGMVADTMQAAQQARSLDDLFLRLEDAGIMLRIDTHGHADDGQGAHSRHLGAGPAADPRATSSAEGTSRPSRAAGWLRRRAGVGRRRRRRRALRRGGPEVPASRPGVAPGRRSRCSRSGPVSPASEPR